MSTEWPSLEILHTEIDGELARLERRSDAIDARIAVVLGLAGAVIAIAQRDTLLGRLASVLAGVSAAMGLWAYGSRLLPNVSVRNVRDEYLLASREHTMLALLDTKIDVVRALDKLLNRKAKWFNRGLAVLAMAGALALTSRILGV